MNKELTVSYKKFVDLFENYSIKRNKDLLQIKKAMISGFQKDPSALQGEDCIVPLIDLRLRMNHFFFATDDERDTVDNLLTNAFRNNAHLVTTNTVTARLEKIYKDNNVDWGGHLAIAGTMVAAKPKALEDKAWDQLATWSKNDEKRDNSDTRRTFVDLFAQRCRKEATL